MDMHFLLSLSLSLSCDIGNKSVGNISKENCFIFILNALVCHSFKNILEKLENFPLFI